MALRDRGGCFDVCLDTEYEIVSDSQNDTDNIHEQYSSVDNNLSSHCTLVITSLKGQQVNANNDEHKQVRLLQFICSAQLEYRAFLCNN